MADETGSTTTATTGSVPVTKYGGDESSRPRKPYLERPAAGYQQTDDLRQEIENNLAIIKAGVGVHEGAQLELDPPRLGGRFAGNEMLGGLDAIGSEVPETNDPRRLQSEQVVRAWKRLKEIVEERNPGGAKDVPWVDLVRAANARDQSRGTKNLEHFKEERSGLEPHHQSRAAQEFKQPGVTQRDEWGVRAGWQEERFDALDRALAPILARDDVTTSAARKPPRNEAEASAVRNAAAKKALE